MVQDGLNEVKDCIKNVRESVLYIKKTPARLKEFGKIAKQLNANVSNFSNSNKGLCHDVPTRWNSTYLMLESALIYKSVFQQYQLRDHNYMWLPSEEDWEKVEKLKPFLEVFYETTHIFSATSSPTAHQFLPEVWKVKEVLFLNSKSDDVYIRKMAEAMSRKFEKYWGECNLLMSIAAILDPRFKMKLIDYCFPKIYESWEVDDNITMVRAALYDIYQIYVDEEASSRCEEESAARQATSGGSSKGKTRGRCEFEDYLRSTFSVQPLKSELDMYLEESNVICNDIEDKDFDALKWWKMNNLKFRILSKMARDILSIPISTVASESAFSAGGRVLDDYRSSLSTETVEVLVCAADWLRANQHIIKSPILEDREEERLHVDIPSEESAT